MCAPGITLVTGRAAAHRLRSPRWVDVGMPYCGGHNNGTDYICGGTCVRTGACANPDWDPYRSDCSGYVSWAWGLPPTGSGGRTTGDTGAPVGGSAGSPSTGTSGQGGQGTGSPSGASGHASDTGAAGKPPGGSAGHGSAGKSAAAGHQTTPPDDTIVTADGLNQEREQGGGCATTSASSGALPAWSLVALALVGARRRRSAKG